MNAKAPVFPIIYESVYGEEGNPEFTARDAAINSDLLQLICERLVNIKLNDGEFGTRNPFRLRIEDQHDDEDQPHYVLDVGNSINQDPLENCVSVDYCDNYSDKDRTIKQARGKFKVWASKRVGNFSSEFAATALARAYVDALKTHFPDFFILVDEKKLELPG
ncbi:hypothetical protein IJM16_00600 [Candidatus Saccharibacteria bacterium]|nr:hypothetical protein [Candidatus Saccharibacteria bacterium]